MLSCSGYAGLCVSEGGWWQCGQLSWCLVLGKDGKAGTKCCVDHGKVMEIEKPGSPVG